MSPALLHQLWSLVTQKQSNLLLDLDDGTLIEEIVRQIACDRSIDVEDTARVRDYLSTKVTLIRDLTNS